MKLRDAKLRSSCPEVFYKKGVIRNFAKVSVPDTFLIKLQAWPANLFIKKSLAQVFSCEF